MENSNRRLAILGGTFDPVHFGHLLIAEQARNHFLLDKILFMPAAIPPHKMEKSITESDKRLAMLEVAISNNQYFEISDWELKRSRASYTSETITDYLPQLHAEKVFLIIGADSLSDIFTWHQPELLLGQAEWIVSNRPGYNLDSLLNEARFSNYQDHLYPLKAPFVEISSSIIRKQVKAGLSIRYLTPEPVIDLIHNWELYK